MSATIYIKESYLDFKALRQKFGMWSSRKEKDQWFDGWKVRNIWIKKWSKVTMKEGFWWCL